MDLYYQLEGTQDFNIAEIPDEMIENNQVSYEDIKELLAEEDVATGTGFSFQFWDNDKSAYRRARAKTMIPAQQEIRIKVKSGTDSDSQSSDYRQEFFELQKKLSRQPSSASVMPHEADDDQQPHWNFQNRSPKRRNTTSANQSQSWNRMKVIASTRPKDAESPFIPDSRPQIGGSLDIVIFNSAPLIELVDKKAIPMEDSTLDFESERLQIINALNRNGTGGSIRFDAATVERLIEVLEYKPKIIHISCHGSYDPIKGNQFYLAFEQNKQLGLLDKVTEERLKPLLASQGHDCIVFVSACFSGAIGEVFQKAGFPCVICVNSQTMILDDAAKQFAQNFYLRIMQGKTIGYAYDMAKSLVKDNQSGLVQGCCCSHNHKVTCKWYALRKTMSHDEWHNEHVHPPNCCESTKKAECIHSLDCNWANAFLEKYDPGRLDFTDEEFDNMECVICWCTPEAPHGEGFKFNMICDEAYKETKLFEESSTSIDIENMAPLPEYLRPPHVSKTITGRHVDIQHIVEIISASNKGRILYVTGESGIGKSVVVKMAAMYAFERRVFQDGVLYIDLRHKTDLDAIEDGIANQLEITRQTTDSMLHSYIAKMQFLIILDSVTSLIESVGPQFEDYLRNILEQTSYPKFLIVADQAPENTRGEVFTLWELQQDAWSRIVRSMLSEEKARQIADHETELRRYMGGNPGTIEKMIPVLETSSIEEFIQIMKEQQLTNSPHLYIKSILQRLQEHNQAALSFFQLLLEFPEGLLKTDIQLLWENNENFNWKEIKEELIGKKGETKRQWLVQMSEHSKIREKIYIAAEAFIIPVQEFCSDSAQQIRREAISYLSAAARGILRALMASSQENAIEIDSLHVNFNASLCVGLWKDLDEARSKLICDRIQNSHPSERFKLLEMNFQHYVKLFAEKPQVLNRSITESLREMMLCVTSIYILQGRYDQAINFGQLCEKCSEKLDDEEETASIIQLVMANAYFLSGKPQEAKNYVLDSSAGFRNKKIVEGIAECYLLQAQITAWKEEKPESVKEDDEEVIATLAIKRSDSEPVRRISSWSIAHEESVENYYDHADRRFCKTQWQFGIARLLILKSEFLLNNPQQLVCDISLVKTFLMEAQSITEFFKDKVWELKCVIMFGEYYKLNKSWSKAREKYQAAKELAKKHNYRKQERLIKAHLQHIKHEIRTSSVNNVTILIGNPLVKRQGPPSHIERIGPVCRLSNSNHLSDLLEEMSKCNKVVNVKVDHLNRSSLKQVDHGSRIVILESDVGDPDNLIVEGQTSEAESIPIENLEKSISRDIKGVDVVLIAIPQSMRIAQYFHEHLGVAHVIAFDFPSIAQQEDHGHFNIRARQLVFNFCITFYNYILQTYSVKAAMQKAEKQTQKELDRIRSELAEESVEALNSENFGPVLLDPDNLNHNIRIFSDREVSLCGNIKMLTFGKVMSVSRNLPPNNLNPIKTIRTGRQIEIHSAIEALSTTPVVQVIAGIGFGKTYFLRFLANYVHQRKVFTQGVFFFDLKGCDSMGMVNEKFDSEGIDTKSNEKQDILLIFDNWDKLIKENTASFATLLHVYAEQCGFKILISSQKELQQQRMTVPIRTKEIYLKELNDIESATFVYNAVNNRQLTKSEITKEETDEALLTILAKQAGVKECKGNPSRLLKFAEYLKNESFQNVQQITSLASNVIRKGLGGLGGLKKRSKTVPPANPVALSIFGKSTFDPKQTPSLTSSLQHEKVMNFARRQQENPATGEIMKQMKTEKDVQSGILKAVFAGHAGRSEPPSRKNVSFKDADAFSIVSDSKSKPDPVVNKLVDAGCSSGNKATNMLLKGIRQQKQIDSQKSQQENPGIKPAETPVPPEVEEQKLNEQIPLGLKINSLDSTSTIKSNSSSSNEPTEQITKQLARQVKQSPVRRSKSMTMKSLEAIRISKLVTEAEKQRKEEIKREQSENSKDATTEQIWDTVVNGQELAKLKQEDQSRNDSANKPIYPFEEEHRNEEIKKSEVRQDVPEPYRHFARPNSMQSQSKSNLDEHEEEKISPNEKATNIVIAEQESKSSTLGSTCNQSQIVADDESSSREYGQMAFQPVLHDQYHPQIEEQQSPNESPHRVRRLESPPVLHQSPNPDDDGPLKISSLDEDDEGHGFTLKGKQEKPLPDIPRNPKGLSDEFRVPVKKVEVTAGGPEEYEIQVQPKTKQHPSFKEKNIQDKGQDSIPLIAADEVGVSRISNQAAQQEDHKRAGSFEFNEQVDINNKRTSNAPGISNLRNIMQLKRQQTDGDSLDTDTESEEVSMKGMNSGPMFFEEIPIRGQIQSAPNNPTIFPIEEIANSTHETLIPHDTIDTLPDPASRQQVLTAPQQITVTSTAAPQARAIPTEQINYSAQTSPREISFRPRHFPPEALDHSAPTSPIEIPQRKRRFTPEPLNYSVTPSPLEIPLRSRFFTPRYLHNSTPNSLVEIQSRAGSVDSLYPDLENPRLSPTLALGNRISTKPRNCFPSSTLETPHYTRSAWFNSSYDESQDYGNSWRLNQSYDERRFPSNVARLYPGYDATRRPQNIARRAKQHASETQSYFEKLRADIKSNEKFLRKRSAQFSQRITRLRASADMQYGSRAQNITRASSPVHEQIHVSSTNLSPSNSSQLSMPSDYQTAPTDANQIEVLASLQIKKIRRLLQS